MKQQAVVRIKSLDQVEESYQRAQEGKKRRYRAKRARLAKLGLRSDGKPRKRS